MDSSTRVAARLEHDDPGARFSKHTRGPKPREARADDNNRSAVGACDLSPGPERPGK